MPFNNMVLKTCLLLYLLSLSDASIANERDNLLRNEALMSLGGNITLTDKESVVNTCLMKYKFNELDFAFQNPDNFNFSQHYFKYKDNIKDSKVYKIIKDMPKGAVLHIHDMGILSPDYLMNMTYMDHLYICFKDEKIELKFANKTPKDVDKKWHLLSQLRNTSTNVTQFDEMLRKHFTLVVPNPDKVYPGITETWSAFMKYFLTVQPLLTYRKVWEQYFYDVLKAFRKQNVLYIEVRSILPRLYELDGTQYESLITAKAYKKVTNRFVKDYPDFVGAKLIYAPPRKVDKHILDDYLKLAARLKDELSDFFAGFDLVGQEDLGCPLIEFERQLSSVSDINFFFHAGETDWYGSLTDRNIVDAILLGAKRIGHAYALPKHPLLIKEVLKRDIGLEVNVISNTVLSLVKDVRNHPLSTFFAQGLPVVLSSDDPGAWEADVISHDFYVAFVGVASRLSDLRILKALALNSLKYSALQNEEKVSAIKSFHKQWADFIDKFDCSRY